MYTPPLYIENGNPAANCVMMYPGQAASFYQEGDALDQVLNLPEQCHNDCSVLSKPKHN